MTHSNLVANEIRNTGFEAVEFSDNQVFVSLQNRKASIMELRKVLDKLFDVIEMTCQSTTHGVLVSW